MPKVEKVSFEKSLERIDEIVKSLERGDAPLDEALALFEEGTKLIKSCEKILDGAEQKVVALQKGESGEAEERDFTAQE